MTRSCAPMALGGKLVLNLALTAPLQHTNTEMLHVRNRLARVRALVLEPLSMRRRHRDTTG